MDRSSRSQVIVNKIDGSKIDLKISLESEASESLAAAINRLAAAIEKLSGIKIDLPISVINPSNQSPALPSKPEKTSQGITQRDFELHEAEIIPDNLFQSSEVINFGEQRDKS